MTRWARLVLFGLALFFTVPPTTIHAASPERMVKGLTERGIRDKRVLDAFRRVPREAFVPLDERERAYEDGPLPIGHGQTISQPYVVALMTELLDLDGNERVLEIGTGSGYQAAILAELAREVYTVEIVPQLATTARLRLTREGYRNVHVKQGDGYAGWREYGPYAAVVVTAVAPKVPQALIDQLEDGGILVMPIGDPNGRQVLIRGVKRGGKLRSREVTDVRFVPMTGAVQERDAKRPGAREDGAKGERTDGDVRRRAEEGRDLDRRPKSRDDRPDRGQADSERERDDGDEEEDDAEPRRDDDRRRKRVYEEDLSEERDAPERDDLESEPRSLRPAPGRVGRAPNARGIDRRRAAVEVGLAAADSRAVAR